MTEAALQPRTEAARRGLARYVEEMRQLVAYLDRLGVEE